MEQVADLSSSVTIQIVNDGRPNVDECLYNDLLENKSKILQNGCVIDFSTESNYYLKDMSDKDDIFTFIHKILQKADISADLVHFCTGNLLNKQNYSTYISIKKAQDNNFLPFKSAFFKDFWLSQTVSFHKNHSENYNKTAKPKYFSCLNGRQRTHREYVYNYLNQYDLIDKGISTFVWKGISVDGFNTPEDIRSHKEQKPEFYKVFDNTYYDIITETLTGEESKLDWWQEVFITEKIWRSIYYKRPFMVIGNKNTLYELKNLGFKTFEGILFDESYDNLDDFQMRTYSVLEQNKQIIDTKSLQDVNDIVYSEEMSQILDYNYNKINKLAEFYRQAR